jgi:hypothetical protein
MTNKRLTHRTWISIVSESLLIKNRNTSNQSVDFVLVPKGCISNVGRLIAWKVPSIGEMLNADSVDACCTIISAAYRIGDLDLQRLPS